MCRGGLTLLLERPGALLRPGAGLRLRTQRPRTQRPRLRDPESETQTQRPRTQRFRLRDPDSETQTQDSETQTQRFRLRDPDSETQTQRFRLRDPDSEIQTQRLRDSDSGPALTQLSPVMAESSRGKLVHFFCFISIYLNCIKRHEDELLRLRGLPVLYLNIYSIFIYLYIHIYVCVSVCCLWCFGKAE